MSMPHDWSLENSVMDDVAAALAEKPDVMPENLQVSSRTTRKWRPTVDNSDMQPSRDSNRRRFSVGSYEGRASIPCARYSIERFPSAGSSIGPHRNEGPFASSSGASQATTGATLLPRSGSESVSSNVPSKQGLLSENIWAETGDSARVSGIQALLVEVRKAPAETPAIAR